MRRVPANESPNGPTQPHGVISVRPCDAVTTVWFGGRQVPLPRGEAALLSLLAAVDRPVNRRDLARAASVSPRSVASMLSRLPGRFGLRTPIHELVGNRSGLVALASGAVRLDLEGVTAAPQRSVPCLQGLGLPETDALVMEARGSVRAEVERWSVRRPLAHADDHGLVIEPASVSQPSEGDRTRALLAAAADEVGAVDQTLAGHLARRAGIDLGDLPTQIGDQERGALAALPDTDRRWLHRTAFAHLVERRPLPLLALAHHAAHSADTGARHRALALILDRVEIAMTLPAQEDTDVEPMALIDAAWQLSPGRDARSDLTLLRAEIHARSGPWDAARSAFQDAIEAAMASNEPTRLAMAALGMARVTWDEAAASQAGEALRLAAEELSAGSTVLGARVQLCLAGGLYQTGWVESDTGEATHDALDIVEGSLDARARAWAALHARKAELGRLDPVSSLDLAVRIGALGAADPVLAAHADLATFVDLLRVDRRGRARRALTALQRSPDVTPDQRFSRTAATVCWDLMMGRLGRAAVGHEHLGELASALPAQTADQVLLGQHMGLAIERDDADELSALADAAATADDFMWQGAHVLLATLAGRHGDARAGVQRLAAATDGFRSLPSGAHRLPVLCTAIHALWANPDRADADDRVAAGRLAAELRRHPEQGVLVGWPTLFLGPTSRYRAMAAWLTDRPLAALVQARAALHADRWSGPHLARSLDVAARIAGATGDEAAARTYRAQQRELTTALARRWETDAIQRRPQQA